MFLPSACSIYRTLTYYASHVDKVSLESPCKTPSVHTMPVLHCWTLGSVQSASSAQLALRQPTAADTSQIIQDDGWKFWWRCHKAEEVSRSLRMKTYDSLSTCVKLISASTVLTYVTMSRDCWLLHVQARQRYTTSPTPHSDALLVHSVGPRKHFGR